MKRLRKFRNKNWLYVFSLKLGIIFYSMTFSILYLTGATGAYFSDTASVNGVIQVATWWDKSSLTFITSKKQSSNKNQCVPITAVIKNGGDSNMQGPVNYEVWWAEKGNPKDGVKVGGGEVKALKSGESLNLSYEITKDGNYKFKAYQRAGHPGQGELWSEETAVTCFNAKSVEEPKDNPEKTEESKTPDQEQQQPEKSVQPQQSEPVTPEAAQEKTEQVPTTQTGEVKEETKPSDSTNRNSNAQGTSKESTTEPAQTNPQPVEQNETQKDDSK